MRRNDDFYPPRWRRDGTGPPGRAAEHTIPLEAVTQYADELAALLPAGPPGPPGGYGPKMIAFFNFWPSASWTTDPPKTELDGTKVHRWMADVFDCDEIRVSALCHSSGSGPVLLAVEYSVDGTSWIGGYAEGNYTTLAPGLLPTTSGWSNLKDPAAQYFRLVLLNKSDIAKSPATAELGPITVEVRKKP